ncbi:MAG: tRNA lysidine(34) synthetase TilS [Steroidobacteraceae bacterium]
MRFSAELLWAVLEETLPPGATGLLAALSGGPDSSCLVAALAHARAQAGAYAAPQRALPLRAVHVDHGLQAMSSAMRDAGAALCRRFDVPLEVVRVEVDMEGGVSIEAAARAARYRAFASVLKPGECLLTAHHALDQAETLLLQLLRGAGLKGLSAMPVRRPFAHGWHVRPLLDVAPDDLHRLGRELAVEAVDDPMNRDIRFDRAYLRREVWPRIERRWPAAAASLSRAAQHLGEAQASLDSSTRRAEERLRDGEALSASGLRSLPNRERLHVLRHWISSAGVEPPSTARLDEALHQMLTAQADHEPAVQWGGHVLRRYRDRLFLTTSVLPAITEPLDWRASADSRLPLGAGLGALRWIERPGGLDPARLPAMVCVRRRRGGETLKTGPRARTQSVQHLCQAMGVLPWLRDALPMIYAGDTLIAVGDLWQDARSSVTMDILGLACVWEDAPPLT